MSDGTPNPTTCPRWRGPLAYGHAGATRTCWRFVIFRLRLRLGNADFADHHTSGLAGGSAAPAPSENGRRDNAQPDGEREAEQERESVAGGPRARRRSRHHSVGVPDHIGRDPAADADVVGAPGADALFSAASTGLACSTA